MLVAKWPNMSKWTVILIATGTLAASARALLFPVTVVGDSMRPTLRPGDRLVARRSFRRGRVRRGDVVIVSHPRGHGPDRLLIKRVWATGGQRPRESDEIVPLGSLYILGDSTRSLDSRQLGYINLRQVRGVVVGCWWPVRRRVLL